MSLLFADETLSGLPDPIRRWSGTFDLVDGPPKAGTLDEQLRAELANDDGTPEWRRWVQRACERHRIT